MKFAGIFKTVGDFVVKNSETILTVLGCTGVAATAIMTAKATVISCEAYHKNIEYFNDPEDKREIVKEYWRNYVPPVIMGVSTIACIIGARSVSARRQLALASAYSLAEKSLTEYQNEVKELIGEKKHEKIVDNIDKRHIEENPVGKNEIIVTGKGETLCYDNYSGRYFKSDIEKIRKIENQLNKRMMSEMFIGLNELYFELGLAPTPMGNDFGWNIDEEGPIDIRYSAQLTEDDVPCLVLSYTVGPRFNLGR